jgi:putative hydrolase of the HAD superfamily
MTITTVGIDADDTLWHNETIFRLTHDRFAALLAPWARADHLLERLAAVERRNLQFYGYGVKGFTLSMLETALELTGGDIPAAVTREVLAAGREMLCHPVEPLAGVEEALAALSARWRLVLITKGDLFDQENKLARSGLGDLFHAVEVVSEKTAASYRTIFERHGAGPDRAVMIGNSVKSDILPAIEAGAWAAYIPYVMTWAHEVANPPVDHPRYVQLASISEVPDWVAMAERRMDEG